MASRLFRAHGHFCATHPWEVIVATLTLAACMLSYEQRPRLEAERRNNATDVILMTLVRCIAVLYSYYQVCNLHQLGSKYLLVIAALFTAFSSFIFTSAVLNVFDVSDLKDALFFFLLLIDLSKIASLARFAMSSSSQDEIRHNISRGMARIGPSITLDTVVETLVIGVGTLSGVHRLETLCKFACLSVIVNYIVFMTFYPACLSLILELSRSADYKILYNDVSQSFFCNLKDENDKPNLVVQRIKLIMSAGLMLVHAHSRWLLSDERYGSPNTAIATDELFMQSNCTETPSTSLQGTIIKWLTVSADQIVILILLLALAVKFMMFKPKTEAQVTLSELDIKLRQKYKAKFGVDWIEDTKTLEVGVQTEVDKSCIVKYNEIPEEIEVQPPRSLEECKTIYKQDGPKKLSDVEIISLVKNKIIPFHQMENIMGDLERGVEIRRKYIEAELNRKAITDLPYQHYDYSKVMGACCENVIGYVPVPVGVAGPLNMDEKLFYVPMATTEGCLVASTNRGCRALMRHGVTTRVVADGMTRGPVVRFPSVARASLAMAWIKQPDSFDLIKSSFDATSGYARLTTVQVRIAGRYLFIRFVAKTGDAMGMNMLSKGTEVSLKFVQTHFEDMEIISLSGNYCADKKPAAVNWIEGRGKSVVCEAIVPADIVSSVLKTSVHALVDVNISKNMIGSAMAGSIGGFNAHAANVVTAIFIATGQDPAQNVSSSNCMTLMEPWGEKGDDLYISCTMPSIEIGTVGGGTTLGPQASCLEMLGVKGANVEHVGENANQLAKIICGTVLAGELSLMAALSAGHLVGSHLKYNRALKLTPCKSDSS